MIGMKMILTTGGAGFIGSNFIRYFLRRNKNFIVVNIDKQAYPAEFGRLSDLENSPRYHHIKGDVCNQDLIEYVFRKFRPSWIINFCTEPEQMKNPGKFVYANTSSFSATLSLLEGARSIWGRMPLAEKRFIQVSADDVYGFPPKANEGLDESAPLMPSDPYAAIKAGADLMVSAYNTAYNIPTVILRCCSIYGPWQNWDCTVPSVIRSILAGKEPQLRGEGPSREWLHVTDLSAAITRALFFASPGSTFNIGSGDAATPAELSAILSRLAGIGIQSEKAPAPEKRKAAVKILRLDSGKAAKKLKWTKGYSLEEGLDNVLKWYENHQDELD
jgi:dTDP-glucose 4,6-dehydratase